MDVADDVVERGVIHTREAWDRKQDLLLVDNYQTRKNVAMKYVAPKFTTPECGFHKSVCVIFLSEIVDS